MKDKGYRIFSDTPFTLLAWGNQIFEGSQLFRKHCRLVQHIVLAKK